MGRAFGGWLAPRALFLMGRLGISSSSRRGCLNHHGLLGTCTAMSEDRDLYGQLWLQLRLWLILQCPCSFFPSSRFRIFRLLKHLLVVQLQWAPGSHFRHFLRRC